MDAKGIDTLIFSFMFSPYNVYFLNPGLMPINVMFSTYVIFHFTFLSPEEILTRDFISIISSYICLKSNVISIIIVLSL